MLNPLIPMLAITGKPTEEEVSGRISKYADCGFCQLMLYPRDGCELDYLSDEWFDTIEALIRAGKRYDMRFWLYDEYNYPSGGCKGRVMAEGPAFCINYLKAEREGEHFRPSRLTVERYPNILNPEAVDYFISLTHKEYEKRLGKYFGKEIAGIFTDEPSFYYGVWEKDELPFYDGMDEDYKTLCGNDFYSDYDLYYSGKGAEMFLVNCYKLLAGRMNVSYVKKIASWCEKNGLYMTGHLMEDDLSVKSVRANGNLLKQLSGFSLPAVDDIFTNVKNARLLMPFSAVRYASRNKDGAAAELFALGPCDISFSKLKNMIWYAALFGVDHYFLAISHFKARGNAFRKYYYNDFSPFSPQAFAYEKLGEEAKLAAGYAREATEPDVYLRFPLEAVTERMFEENNVISLWEEIIKTLTRHQVEYLVIDDETPQDKPIIEISEKGFSLNGEIFDSAEEVAKILRPEKIYTDENGLPPENVLIRRYKNKKTVLLNLSENEKILFFDNKKITLPPYGVKLPDEKESEYETVFAAKPIKTVFSGNNISGAAFDEKRVFEFELKDDIEFIFAIRAFPENACVYLDGEPIKASEKCDILPENFADLYLKTGKVISAGKHILTTAKDSPKYKYLPDLIFTGDFFRRGNVFSKTRFSGKEVPRYGECEYFFKVALPDEPGLALRLEGLDTPVRLCLDGKVSKTFITAPYILKPGNDHSGKIVTLTAKTASCFSPLFGDTALVETYDGTPKWCAGYTPAFETDVPEPVIKIIKIKTEIE